MKLPLPAWLRRRADAPTEPDAAAAATPLPAPPRRRRRWRLLLAVVLVIAAGFWALGFYWSREPGILWVVRETPEGHRAVVGYSTVNTLIDVIDWMLDKPGGYLSNDVLPPGVWLDNMPSFEFGVLTQCRDLARVLRNYYSRSQSQSIEDDDLAIAEPALNTDNTSWLLPPAETKYREAAAALRRYRDRLTDDTPGNAQFFARADNLREWLAVVELRLGNLSQRLSASVGQVRVNTDLGGAPAGEASSQGSADVIVKTPWLEIDDVFYEARGTAWALLLFLRAAQFDFERTLEDKNAVVSLRQVIRELEEGLAPIRSPMILNGQGYGLFPNHSLVLASYLSRAHSAIADLRSLLEQG
ncbi:MAG TPA: DUF2333 family protein [Gammaproteobacteria bacterium]|jgi:hypothetical protein|nr:DUF2333 family protein [Gammaproteobacteria bacterium]